MMILGDTVNEIGNRLDQVSGHPVLFHFGCLNFGNGVHFLSFGCRKVGKLVYVGCNGATYVYTSCITVARVYVPKIEFLTLD
jgi:hypothetical protein